MCGIVGFAGARRDGLAVLEAMAAAIEHRGPDEAGHYLSDEIGLAIRRLAIIDVAGGHQPYTNETGSVRAVFNGEIYGFKTLRDDLVRSGHRFLTHADGEVIVHGYEEHGADFLRQIDGMFALAVWDGEREKLLLARDRLGKKPLYMAEHGDGGLSFASELQALAYDPKVPREVDSDSIALYLQFGYVPWPRSAFRGVQKLAPGAALEWSAGSTRGFRYWDLNYEPKLELGRDAAVDGFDGRVRAATEARLISDVPLGAFLSGGLDSTLVAAHMSEASAEPIKTFSIGFSDKRYDERPFARAIAERLGTDHHEEAVGAEDVLDVVHRLVRHYGEPYADSSMIPTYYLARMARRHVTVALTGDGGDELLAGYERHAAARYAAGFDRLPSSLRSGIAALGRGLARPGADQKALSHKLARLARSIDLLPGARYADWSGSITHAERQALFGNLGPVVNPELLASATHPLDQALAADVSHYLPDDLLTKVDIATMACSLEARSPLLDYRLVEWAARLPVELKQRRFRGKLLIRDALARRLPRELFERPKMGFAAPVGDWLRGSLRELAVDTLLDAEARQRGYLRPAAVERYLHAHLSGRHDHTRAIWTMLMLELWFREVAAAPVSAGEAAIPRL